MCSSDLDWEHDGEGKKCNNVSVSLKNSPGEQQNNNRKTREILHCAHPSQKTCYGATYRLIRFIVVGAYPLCSPMELDLLVFVNILKGWYEESVCCISVADVPTTDPGPVCCLALLHVLSSPLCGPSTSGLLMSVCSGLYLRLPSSHIAFWCILLEPRCSLSKSVGISSILFSFALPARCRRALCDVGSVTLSF